MWGREEREPKQTNEQTNNLDDKQQQLTHIQPVSSSVIEKR